MSIQDLDQRFPITNKDGTPSDYFMRLLRDRGSSQSTTETTVETLSDDVATLTTTKADKVTDIIAGAGLTGGGDLSADRTLAVGAGTGITVNADDVALSNTAVTPGSYTNTNLTVDAQGRLTAAANGSGGGGGGGGWTVIGTYDHAVDGSISFKTFTGLNTYTDILIVGSGITLSASAFLLGQVSTDGGATFYTAGTDHVIITATTQADGSGSGTLLASSTSTSVARSILWRIHGNGSPSVFGLNLFSDTITRRFVGSSSVINAIKIGASGVNMTGGSFTVYGQ